MVAATEPKRVGAVRDWPVGLGTMNRGCDLVAPTKRVGAVRDWPVGLGTMKRGCDPGGPTKTKHVCSRRRFTKYPIAPPEHAIIHIISSDSFPRPKLPAVRIIGPKPKPASPFKRSRLDRGFVSKLENSHGASWVRVGFLGKGAFGCVSLARNTIRVNKEVEEPGMMAVKSAPFDCSQTLQREKRILAGLEGCRYIVGCYGDEVTCNSDGEEVYNLLLEYCSGLSLACRLNSVTRMGEYEVGVYTHDVLLGLLHMHDKGFVHCDIKPDNILLVPNATRTCGFMAKIADFGLTKRLAHEEDDGMGVVRGTYRYMAPELVKDKMMGCHVDIWALGCTVLEMLTGRPPWDCEKDKDAILSMIERYNVPDIPDFVSPLAREFLAMCFRRNCVNRWDASRLLGHPFVIFFVN